MRVHTQTVTPALAAEWFAGRAPNRNLRQSAVEAYTRDIRAGKWRLTHQGIAFDGDGRLVDGQHRLAAIVRAGVPVTLSIATGLDGEAVANLDTGAKRNLPDLLRYSFGDTVGPQAVAIANMMRGGFSKYRGRMTAEEMKSWLDEHQDAVAFATKLTTGTNARGLGTAALGAVLARACYHSCTETIEEFYSAVKDPAFAVSLNWHGSKAAILLNQFLLRGSASHSSADRQMVYAKAERALRAFLDNEKLSRLYEASQELFPLPGEEVPS